MKTPAPKPPAIERFHEHQAGCRHCQEHPSGKCSEAETLLAEAAAEHKERYGDYA